MDNDNYILIAIALVVITSIIAGVLGTSYEMYQKSEICKAAITANCSHAVEYCK